MGVAKGYDSRQCLNVIMNYIEERIGIHTRGWNTIKDSTQQPGDKPMGPIVGNGKLVSDKPPTFALVQFLFQCIQELICGLQADPVTKYT